MNPPRIGVVHSRFNEEICIALLESARAELVKAGAQAEFVAVVQRCVRWIACISAHCRCQK